MLFTSPGRPDIWVALVAVDEVFETNCAAGVLTVPPPRCRPPLHAGAPFFFQMFVQAQLVVDDDRFQIVDAAFQRCSNHGAVRVSLSAVRM